LDYLKIAAALKISLQKDLFQRIYMNIQTALLALATIAAVALSSLYFKQQTKQKTGTVIILNGPSASGKSSIQKEFQTLMMPNLWIKHGIDTLFDKPMPDITLENLAFWQSENPIRWVTMSKDADENSIMTLFIGDQGDKVAYGMNSAIAAYAQNGCNVIVDYIAYKKEWIDDLHSKLKNVKTCWIKVAIPLSTLEEREVSRATSPKGHARSHYNTVHWNIKYDFEVNSDKNSAQTIAAQIKEFLKL
jgi:chloramphenicol 3-O phosphotransferase